MPRVGSSEQVLPLFPKDLCLRPGRLGEVLQFCKTPPSHPSTAFPYHGRLARWWLSTLEDQWVATNIDFSQYLSLSKPQCHLPSNGITVAQAPQNSGIKTATTDQTTNPATKGMHRDLPGRMGPSVMGSNFLLVLHNFILIDCWGYGGPGCLYFPVSHR